MAFDETAVFLGDFGKEVVWGSIQAKGILDQPGSELGIPNVSVIGIEYALTFATADLAGLKSGEDLTVAGVGYQVREVKQIDDGVFSQALLKKKNG